jgi:hypothetical protein
MTLEELNEEYFNPPKKSRCKCEGTKEIRVVRIYPPQFAKPNADESLPSHIFPMVNADGKRVYATFSDEGELVMLDDNFSPRGVMD